MRRRQVKWQVRAVQDEKSAIKRELDDVEERLGLENRLSHAMNRVTQLETDDTPRGQLQRFIYIMSSLVHHERHGGLTPSQVKKAVDLARGILLAAGVQSGRSRLSFLYGELYLVVSQIHRKRGRQWLAAWDQQMALYSSRTNVPGGENFQALAMANRAMRLGYMDIAIAQFSQAASGELAAEQTEKARLGLIKAYRLSAASEKASALIHELRGERTLSERGLRELKWEEMCLEIQTDGSPDRMLAAIRRGGTHDDPGYLLEASFWTKAFASREWMKRIILVRTMARRPDLKPQRLGKFYEFACVMEQCYERESPLTVRLARLGETLEGSRDLTTIDKELLAWAAAARFLARSSAFSLASLTLSEYVALSLKITGGTTKDALGIMSDVIERPWFREHGHNLPLAG